MTESLDFITKNSLPALSKELTTVSNLDDFFTNCLQPMLPSVKAIENAHQILLEYIKHKDAVYWIRDYHNVEKGHPELLQEDKKNYRSLRRGWVTKFNDCTYAYCDNSFSTIFYALAYHNKFPQEVEALTGAMTARKFPYGEKRFIDRHFEVPLQGYSNSIAVKKTGWKLSHLHPIKAEYDFAHDKKGYKTHFQSYFTRGIRSEYEKTSGFHHRSYEMNICAEHKTRLIAHFLRLVHPINHFLTPNKYSHKANINIKGNDIGEDPRMLHFMKQKIKQLYPLELIQEFEYYAKVPKGHVNPTPTLTPFTLTYGLNCNPKANSKAEKPTAATKKSKPTQISGLLERRKIDLSNSNLSSALNDIFTRFNSESEKLINGGFKTPTSVAAIAMSVVEQLNKEGKLSAHYSNLANPTYNKQEFGLRYALLRESTEALDNENRYGRNLIRIKEKTYRITNDWYAPTVKNPTRTNHIQMLYNWCYKIYSQNN